MYEKKKNRRQSLIDYSLKELLPRLAYFRLFLSLSLFLVWQEKRLEVIKKKRSFSTAYKIMTESIDERELNFNLRYRFDYLSKFLNFTQDDINLLNQFAVILLPRIPFVTDNVYRNILSFDITKQYFLIRNDGFEGHLTKNSAHLNIDSSQMIYRRERLSVYLRRILTQTEWTDSFLAFLSHVGKMHTDQLGSKSINIDYIHINALFSYIEHLLIDILWTHEDLDMKSKSSMSMAINKLFWIQNDFFTMHYLHKWQDDEQYEDISTKQMNHCCF